VSRDRRFQRSGQGPILVVEDDPQVSSLLLTVLERSRHRAVLAETGDDALRCFFDRRPSLVLLDIDIPGADGWTVLGRIRELSNVPVLMLTGHGSELSKVQALNAGADDYVVKPFSVAELVARIDALLRRARPDEAPLSDVHDDGVVRIDYVRREVTVCSRPVRLTPTEFRMLVALVRHPGQVLSRTQLQEMVWGDSGVTSGDEVRVYVRYLRRKFEDVVDEAPIETVRGFGYRYEPALVGTHVG
jgi:DNA-binding response OmpR family regulator